MLRILGKMAAFKRPHGFFGLLAAVLVATQVVAYPLDDDHLAAHGAVSRDAFAELPAAVSAGAWSTESLPGLDHAASVHLFVDPSPAARQDVDFAKPAQADPLRRALRAVVNVTASRERGASAAAVVLPTEQLDPFTPILGDEITAAVLRMEEGLAEVLGEALDARVDEDGRVTFSMAGVEGFHLSAGNGQVSLGHGDTVFAFSQDRSASLGGGSRRSMRSATPSRERCQALPICCVICLRSAYASFSIPFSGSWFLWR
jgi:limonene-1,2-epoxide hydrolase